MILHFWATWISKKQERRKLFPYNAFVSHICYQGIFFQVYVEMELKISFMIFEGFLNSKNKT